MRKKMTGLVLACLGSSVFAGLIDHGDYTGFPNVNVEAHVAKIARTHFPEIAKPLPVGLSRKAAWTQDVKKAAEGKNIAPEVLEAFLKFVLEPQKEKSVRAPHPDLLEFELYAAGRRELFTHPERKIPQNWETLLKFPVEKRRYTTIPVQYYLILHQPSKMEDYKVIEESIKQGCFDTQGCLLGLIKKCSDVPFCNPTGEHIEAYKLAFRKQFVNFTPKKSWRYVNENDYYLRVWGRQDRFVKKLYYMYDIIYCIYSSTEKELRDMCEKDPALRDLIVAVGLTNRGMKTVRKVAFEYARKSPLNYPILALRLPYEEGQKLLKDVPEHQNLRDLLTIKQLTGEAKIKAIDAYIAKYPDYTEKDMPVTSIALNTHQELDALAGLELFNMGRYKEAAERWADFTTPEDLGLIAEQVMSIEELTAFCKKHYPETLMDEYLIYSDDCSNNNKLLYPDFLEKKAIGQFMRNLLARRLMRAGKVEEAGNYFCGYETLAVYKKFMSMKKKFDSASTPAEEKVILALNLASFLKSSENGLKLYGTLLEPDNLICDNSFKCVWGTKQKAVKLNKPNLYRYSYYAYASDYYGKAAQLTKDRTLKGFALWNAGYLLRIADVKAADKYFKQLYWVAPELTRKNWFLNKDDLPPHIRELEKRIFFIKGDITEYLPEKPVIQKVDLPIKGNSEKELLEFLLKNIVEREMVFRKEQQTFYALSLASDKGSLDASIWAARYMITLRNFDGAFWYLRRAEKRYPDSNKLKYEIGSLYYFFGYWKEALKLFQYVKKNEKNDKDLRSKAIYFAGEIKALLSKEKNKIQQNL